MVLVQMVLVQMVWVQIVEDIAVQMVVHMVV
jgi:hypothetical protein